MNCLFKTVAELQHSYLFNHNNVGRQVSRPAKINNMKYAFNATYRCNPCKDTGYITRGILIVPCPYCIDLLK